MIFLAGTDGITLPLALSQYDALCGTSEIDEESVSLFHNKLAKEVNRVGGHVDFVRIMCRSNVQTESSKSSTGDVDDVSLTNSLQSIRVGEEVFPHPPDWASDARDLSASFPNRWKEKVASQMFPVDPPLYPLVQVPTLVEKMFGCARLLLAWNSANLEGSLPESVVQRVLVPALKFICNQVDSSDSQRVQVVDSRGRYHLYLQDNEAFGRRKGFTDVLILLDNRCVLLLELKVKLTLSKSAAQAAAGVMALTAGLTGSWDSKINRAREIARPLGMVFNGFCLLRIMTRHCADDDRPAFLMDDKTMNDPELALQHLWSFLKAVVTDPDRAPAVRALVSPAKKQGRGGADEDPSGSKKRRGRRGGSSAKPAAKEQAGSGTGRSGRDTGRNRAALLPLQPHHLLDRNNEYMLTKLEMPRFMRPFFFAE